MQSNMWRTVKIGLLLILTFLVVGIPCWITVNRADLPTLEDDDLNVTRAVITPEANGYTHWQQAEELLYWPDDPESAELLRKIAARESVEPARIEKMLERNEAAIAAIERGLNASAFQLPEDTLTTDSLGNVESAATEDVFWAIQRLTKLVGAASRLDVANGDPNGAIEHAMFGMRVGHKLSDAVGTNLLAMMSAAGCQSSSSTDLDRVLRGMELTPGEARELSRRIEANRWISESWSRMWAAEYQFGKKIRLESGPNHNHLELPESWGLGLVGKILGLAPPEYLWQPKRTVASVADYYRDMQRISALNCREGSLVLARAEEQRREHLSGLKFFLSPNLVGKVLNAITLPGSDKFNVKRCHLETRISLIQTRIALQAYVGTKAELPETLNALVPEYLDKVPVDRFDGQPIRYSREERRVFSVGNDYTAADATYRLEADPYDASEPTLAVDFDK